MRIKFPYGTSAENDGLLLPAGELAVDLERKALRLHDGATPGGFELVGERAYYPPPPQFDLLGSGYAFTRIAFPVFNNGLFLMPLSSRTYATSPDLIDWTTRTVTIAPTNQFFTCCFATNGRFVLGGQGTNDGYFTSVDGINWSKVTVGTNRPLVAVQHRTGVFLISRANGDFEITSDATSFLSKSSGAKPLFDGNNGFKLGSYTVFMQAGNFAYTTSTDTAASNWSVTSNGVNNIPPTAGVYFKGLYIYGSNGVGTGYYTSTVIGGTLTNRSNPDNHQRCNYLKEYKGRLYGVFQSSPNPMQLYVTDDGILWTPFGQSFDGAAGVGMHEYNDRLYLITTTSVYRSDF